MPTENSGRSGLSSISNFGSAADVAAAGLYPRCGSFVWTHEIFYN
jgi:hypothetical protein